MDEAALSDVEGSSLRSLRCFFANLAVVSFFAGTRERPSPLRTPRKAAKIAKKSLRNKTLFKLRTLASH
jgi:hypothetical protein